MLRPRFISDALTANTAVQPFSGHAPGAPANERSQYAPQSGKRSR